MSVDQRRTVIDCGIRSFKWVYRFHTSRNQVEAHTPGRHPQDQYPSGSGLSTVSLGSRHGELKRYSGRAQEGRANLQAICVGTVMVALENGRCNGCLPSIDSLSRFFGFSSSSWGSAKSRKVRMPV